MNDLLSLYMGGKWKSIKNGIFYRNEVVYVQFFFNVPR